MDMGININRISWLDNAKMLAMLCVILYHVGSFCPLGEAGTMIESFNMPLFMILSGYACYPSLFKEKTIREWLNYIKKNFVRIMVPCIFVSACALPWTHDKLFFLHGFWFLQCLFCILLSFALVAIVGRIGKKNLFWLPIIFVIASMLLVKRNNLSEMTPYFVMGLILRRYDVLNRLFNKPKKIRCFAIVGG